jgi:hypothetical protein
MGGSGSGGWTPTPASNPCHTLSFRSAVNSPQPPLLAKLKVGSVLKVRLQTSPQTAVVLEHKAKTVGALTGPKVARLINCLQNGYTFEAEVLSVAGGECEVEVRPE